MLEGFGTPHVPEVRAKLHRPWTQFVGELPTRVRNVATGERFGARVDDSSTLVGAISRSGGFRRAQ
jgi:hypothetical protein